MTAYLIEFAAFGLAFAGLGAVVAEILRRQPRALAEIAPVVQAFAEPAPQPMRFSPVATGAAVATAPANANLGRQAA